MEACRFTCSPPAFHQKKEMELSSHPFWFQPTKPCSQHLPVSFSCFQHCCFPSFLYRCCWGSAITACFLHFRKVYEGQDHCGRWAVKSACVQYSMMIYPGAYCTCGAAIFLLPTQEWSVALIKWIYGDILLESQVLSQISSNTSFDAQANFFVHFTLYSVEIILRASNWEHV